MDNMDNASPTQTVTAKHVAESYTQQVHILSQGNLNGYKRLFGGTLMGWIDVVAAVVARRHSGHNVTTIFVDSLKFDAPAYANDTVVLTGKITFVGTTSMEVCVKSYVEDLSLARHLINTAYVVMVALDEDEKPVEVPRLILDTEDERRDWDAGQKRRALRKQRKVEKY